QVTDARIGFLPWPVRDHRRRPGYEPEAEKHEELRAQVSERTKPEDAAVGNSRLPTDVAQADPSVLHVPDQNGKAARRSDQAHDPEAGLPKWSAIRRSRDQKETNRRHEEDHRVFGKDADAQDHSSEWPSPAVVLENRTVC